MIPQGSGPGVQTLDGCSVELYRELPYLGELDSVIPLIPPNSSVLELGCGTGRLTNTLIDAGFKPTVVDNSQQMLDAIEHEIPKVLENIEDLHLSDRFDVVLLPSNLINQPDPNVRNAFLTKSAWHLNETGSLFLERHSTDFLRTATVGMRANLGPFTARVTHVSRLDHAVAMCVEYTRDRESWTHSFEAAILERSDIESLLNATGLEIIQWFGKEYRWLQARIR